MCKIKKCANCKHLCYDWKCGNEESEFHDELMYWKDNCDKFLHK